MAVSLKDAAWILYGYVEQKCRTTNCKEMVMVPPWFKPQANYCETCRAMVIDDFRGLDNEADIDEEDNERD